MVMHRSTLVRMAILWGITIVIYLGVWPAEFVYEDFGATGMNVVTPMPIQPLRTRSLTRISYRLDRAVGHGHPRPFHLSNLALHLANGTLVYAFVGAILPIGAATLAAAIFLWHPLQTEAVCYIAGRTELLGTFWILLACWMASRTNTWSGFHQLTVLGALGLAILSKESAVVGVPLLLLTGGLIQWVHGPVPGWASTRRLLWLGGGAAALGMAMTVWWFEIAPLAASRLSWWKYYCLQAISIWEYLGMVIIPYGLTVDHDFELIPYAVQMIGGLALCVLAIYSYMLWIARDVEYHPKITLTVWGIAWVLIALCLRLVIKVPEPITEHHLYLPMVGIAWILAAVYARSVPRESLAYWNHAT